MATHEPDGEPETLTLATHNVWVGQHVDDLRRNLTRLADDLDQPHAILLQEATRGGAWTIPGYVPVVAPASLGADHDNCRILVRDDGEILDEDARKVPGGEWMWRRPKPARIFVAATVQWGDAVVTLIGVHRVPRGPKPHREQNRRAWKHEHRMLVEWRADIERAHPGRVVVIGGDWNTRKSTLPDHPCSLRSLARAIGATIRVKGIDGFLITGGEAGKARKLTGRYGSDAHRPVVVTVTI